MWTERSVLLAVLCYIHINVKVIHPHKATDGKQVTNFVGHDVVINADGEHSESYSLVSFVSLQLSLQKSIVEIQFQM